MPVVYNGKCWGDLEVLVVKGNKPALMGRDWLQVVKLNWPKIWGGTDVHRVNEFSEKSSQIVPDLDKCPKELQKLVKDNAKLFTSKGSGIKQFKARLQVKEGVYPVYEKYRPVPYAEVEKVEEAYKSLMYEDIVVPIEHLEWASPVVCVSKPQGGKRICGDYKAVNLCIEDYGYKLPTVQDLLAKLAQHGTTPSLYSVIDLKFAFNQLFLDEASSKLLVLNTHKGLLAPKRLCFGVKTAPLIFQSVMDQILAGLDHVFCFIDDVCICTDGDPQEHLNVLKSCF